ncbi:MAG: hypothetical protein NC823_02670, partial [Candidatus Omnitrophica bacterium]|nr:hypothetical protein [Candidatus Omnitrophota bacterium]
MNITGEEKNYLRDLAKKVAELATLPRQEEMAKAWRRHNRLQAGRPLVLIFPEGAWSELLPESTLRFSDPLLRNWERDLRWRLYYSQHLQDDSVIDDILYVPKAIENTGWGLEVKPIRPEQLRGACHYEPVLVEEKDIEKIKFPVISEDEKETVRRWEIAREIFGDILKVELRGIGGLWYSPMDGLAVWRGFDR